MRNVVAIVDFHNVFNRNVIGITEEQYMTFFKSLVEMIVCGTDDEHFIKIRLYGGWYTYDTMSNAASDVQTKISHLHVFENKPFENRKRLNGTIELAIVQNGLDTIWHNTLQEKQGLPRLRINEDMQGETCSANEARCPVHILKRFVNKKRTVCNTEGCQKVHQQVFYRREQKMVDTMMACDTLTFSNDSEVNSVYVVSDDIDLFPGIAISKVANPNKDIHMLVSCENTKCKYSEILNHYNIDVKTYSL